MGVLALQGDIEENIAATSQALQQLHVDGSVEMVRYPEEIEKIDGLILPGGESTVQSTLAAIQRSLPVIKKRISEGMPVLGTCAGMIMLSKRAYDRIVGDTKQKLIGNLDIVIERNAFGRQNDSFEADLSISMLGKEAFKGVFIRAPAVSEVGKDVEVIGKLNNRIVAVKQKNIIGTAFHPELSSDSRMHRHLINMVLEFKNNSSS
ncbi:MAG TPA: pyridoxal 5'-phosphate synthase glutaminase subunit PdxT [Nitrososphaera sp.]|nr:pyridoxal 5'-phosphate synthase glutaminase subunit PdxT [Nitrososphaera sp.]